MSALHRLPLSAALATAALLAACIQQPPEDPPAQSQAPEPVPAAVAPAEKPLSAAPAQAARNEDPELAKHMQTPEFRREYRTKQEQLQAEALVREEAPWLGQTGLTDEQERSMPRYVRMELGQSLQDANAVKAQDLQYIGSFPEPDGTVYYWRIPDKAQAHGDTHSGPAYAYIRKGTDGIFYTDWGNRTPPQS